MQVWALDPVEIPAAEPASVVPAAPANAPAPFKITNANFDTSNAMIVLSAQDTDAPVMTDFKLVTMDNPKRAYFDITGAILTFPRLDWKFEKGPVQQIRISQFETSPAAIVRVVLNVDDGFNTNNIKVLRVQNTIVVKLKPDTFSGSDYLRNVYRDERTSAGDFYEYTKVTQGEDIKPVHFNTGYYLHSVSARRDAVLINGFGSLMIEKPMILTEPSRIVFDLPNTYVNDEIRNTEYKMTDKDSVKIGQFSVNKARIVIQTQSLTDFIPIFSADNQSLLLANFKKVSSSNLAAAPSSITSYKKEKKDLTSTMRLTFSEPLIHGVERAYNKLTLHLYNVNNLNEQTFKTNFADTVFAKGTVSGSKISIPLEADTVVSTFLGADSKTLQVRIVEPKKVEKAKGAGAGKTVVLDPGHGGTDCGALKDNLLEKDINLTVAKKLRDILAKQGYLVHMTRDDDCYVSLEDRVAFAEKMAPDIFISIHVNSSVKPEINGIETHHWRPDSLDLAQTLHDKLISDVKTNDRGLFKSQFYVINHTTMPAVLVEIGFISNDIERGQLAGDGRKNTTAKAIAEGINAYFKQK